MQIRQICIYPFAFIIPLYYKQNKYDQFTIFVKTGTRSLIHTSARAHTNILLYSSCTFFTLYTHRKICKVVKRILRPHQYTARVNISKQLVIFNKCFNYKANVLLNVLCYSLLPPLHKHINKYKTKTRQNTILFYLT